MSKKYRFFLGANQNMPLAADQADKTIKACPAGLAIIVSFVLSHLAPPRGFEPLIPP